MDRDKIDDNTRDFLKSMPVWEHVEAFGVEVVKFRHAVDCHLGRLDGAERRSDKLRETLSIETKDDPKHCDRHVEASDASNDPAYDLSLNLLKQRVKRIDEIYAMLEPNKPWVKCKLACIKRCSRQTHQITILRLKLPPDYTQTKDVDKLAVAWAQHHGLGLRPTKRVIAGPNDLNLLPGIIGNVPNDRSKHRYLVHFDNGSAGYFSPDNVYPIIWQSSKPWKDIQKLSTDERPEYMFNVYNLLRLYPKRYYIDAKAGSSVNIHKNGSLVTARILSIDEDILLLEFKDGSTESVYRGSSRLLKRHNAIAKQLSNSGDIDHFHASLILFLNDYQLASQIALREDEETTVRKSANTARKSTISPYESIPRLDVELNHGYVPDIRDYQPLTAAQSLHKCNHDCLRLDGKRTEICVSNIVTEFRHLSDLKVPLVLGWKRMICKIPVENRKPKFRVATVYESPCGKLFKQPHTVRKYLSDVDSKLDLDYFCFDREIELNSNISTFKAISYQENIATDKDGNPLENKFISLMNQYDRELLPRDFEYHNETVPHPMVASKGFSFNYDFKSSCDCDGDCYQRATCPCHILNEEFSGFNGHKKGKVSDTCQYVHKRLNSQVPTGIFECNSMCKCSSKCSNRVVQNGIRFRLQIQKFPNQKGWGVITLDDIPKGAFICTYTAELLDNADEYGDSDMYYADLDYISINEKRKGFSSDDEPDEDDDTRYMPRDRNAFKQIHNILGSHDFTLDARMKGNLGRFLNHSCDPNCHAQNVFIETHDLRFPNVAFFALKNIKALDEITWDYNYKLGAIDGRKIICLCHKPNCRGRIL